MDQLTSTDWPDETVIHRVFFYSPAALMMTTKEHDVYFRSKMLTSPYTTTGILHLPKLSTKTATVDSLRQAVNKF